MAATAGNPAPETVAGLPAAAQPLRIALIGNPNSGKTSLFNQLTGDLGVSIVVAAKDP